MSKSPYVWEPPQPQKWEPGVGGDRVFQHQINVEWPEYYPPLNDLESNIRWRAEQAVKSFKDPRHAAGLREACARDMLFWWAGFCYLFETRATGEIGTTIPFIPYPYQLEIALDFEASIRDQKDVAVAKSRDTGLTWIALLTIMHKWMFQDGFTAMLGSKNQDLVDQKGNLNTLFEKVRFNLRRQPLFLLPAGFDQSRHDKFLLLKNPETGGEIEGGATTGDIARSGRYKIILLDEHAAIHRNDQLSIEASTSDAAAARWYISTPRGDSNTFFKKCHSETTKRIDIHWWEHPGKGYQAWQEIEFKDGKTIRGKIRSPWYDYEIRDRNQPDWMIAQELDISFGGSIDSICDSHVLAEWRRSAPEPIETRYVDHRNDGEPALLIFEKPEPNVQYIIAADPSGGTATGSHTAVHGFTVDGLRQVFEYQGRVGLDVLPTLLYILGVEYNWAYLCVENNMGISVLIDLSKGHIDRIGVNGVKDSRIRPYPRKLIATHTKPDGEKVKDRLGITTTEATKRFMVYSLLEPYTREQDMTIRGLRTISEMAGFREEGSRIHNPDGDDLVMALNILLYGHRFMPRQRQLQPTPFISG